MATSGVFADQCAPRPPKVRLLDSHKFAQVVVRGSPPCGPLRGEGQGGGGSHTEHAFRPFICFSIAPFRQTSLPSLHRVGDNPLPNPPPQRGAHPLVATPPAPSNSKYVLRSPWR